LPWSAPAFGVYLTHQYTHGLGLPNAPSGIRERLVFRRNFPAPFHVDGGMLEAIVIWLVLAIVIGVAAARRGRSGLGWLVASLVLSPLIAAIVLALLPDRRYEEALNRLAALDAAADPQVTARRK
jgi:hypothetical protein